MRLLCDVKSSCSNLRLRQSEQGDQAEQSVCHAVGGDKKGLELLAPGPSVGELLMHLKSN